jgi:hypothetical protein
LKQPIVVTASKLALAGEHAGFSIDEMTELLDAGFTVDILLSLFAERLDPPRVN